MWQALNKGLVSKRDKDRTELKEERIRLNTLIKEKKEEKKLGKTRRIEHSKNMSEFWKAVNGFKAEKKKKGGKIGKEEQLKYF